MSELLATLQANVGDRYLVEGEVGRGGMSIVFRAKDTRYGRLVAIKVLRPEVAVSVGGERFLREIRVAANLTHPNILPLHDSDERDGMTYYVMPFVEGESLAEHIQREGPLPVAKAVGLTRQLASALHHAHSQGVVHRDLKPANILLVSGQAMLADFGIARAIGEAPAHGLTGTGVAIGTPAYMSPEQWGAQEIDGRSDLYSLGCLLFEMIEGASPFGAGSLHAVMAGHAAGDVPEVGSTRSDVPPSIVEIVRKCMAKDPADRYQTGEDLIHDLDAESGPTLLEVSLRKTRRMIRRSPWMRGLATVGAAALAYLVWSALASTGGEPPVLRDDVIAVFPFRVIGAQADAGLGATLADLVAQRLPGDHGPRALAPAEAMVAVASGDGTNGVSDQQGLTAARAHGVAEAVIGQVAVTGGSLNVAARILGVRDGQELSQVISVRGSADELNALADELTTRLLAGRAGVEAYRVPTLLGTNLAAVRAYLAGRALHSEGSYGAAAARYDDALDADSTFALAAIGTLSLNLLSEEVRDFTFRAWTLAWPSRATLDARDQRLLAALVGSDYPADPSAGDLRNAWEDVISDRPDEAEPWLHLGVLLSQSGDLLGLPSARADARGALQRAVELDPGSTWAWRYLLDLAVASRDTAAITEYLGRLGELSGDAALDLYHLWRVAHARSDSSAIQALMVNLDAWPYATLLRLVGMAQLDGLGIPESTVAATTLREKAGRDREVWEADILLRALALNGGRPTEARAIPWRPNQNSWNRFHQVMFGLFWDADSAQTVEAAEWVRDSDPLAPGRSVSSNRACAYGLWELHRGSIGLARSAAAGLRTIPVDGTSTSTANAHACAALLEAEVAVRESAADARARVEALDALMRDGPEMWGPVTHMVNLSVARLFDTLGEPERALEAVRRRRRDPVRGVHLLSPMLWEEGRLAEKVGAVEGAIAAYRHFLALQGDPEEAFRPRVEEVREALTRLLGGE